MFIRNGSAVKKPNLPFLSLLYIFLKKVHLLTLFIFSFKGDNIIFFPTKMEGTDELYMQSRNLVFEAVLGHGGFGVVFLVYSSQYQSLFALKRIPLNKFVQSEIECIERLDHPNIIKAFKYETFREFVYLLLEYCPDSLQTKIKQNPGKLSKQDIVRYSKQILLAINQCHKKRIAHRDIKPSNMLLDSYGRIKMTDFGLSQQVSVSNVTQKCSGSFYYKAPEVLSNAEHDPFKADIWSIGVTFYYLATGKLPWPCDDRKICSRSILLGTVNTEGVADIEYQKIIQQCLKFNPKDRPTVDELLANKLFQDDQKLQSQAVNRSVKLTSSMCVCRSPLNRFSASTFSRRPKRRSVPDLP